MSTLCCKLSETDTNTGCSYHSKPPINRNNLEMRERSSKRFVKIRIIQTVDEHGERRDKNGHIQGQGQGQGPILHTLEKAPTVKEKGTMSILRKSCSLSQFNMGKSNPD